MPVFTLVSVSCGLDIRELMVVRIVLLVLSLWALSAWAQQPADSYRVEVQVANQSDAERIAATKAHLGDVIAQITGDTAALQHPLVKQAINDAPNYLAKFTYTSPTSLVLNYSPQAIHSLLQQAQLISAPNNAPQGITLYVVNVGDFATFKQVQAYLKTVGVIRRADLVKVDKELLQFNLVLEGDEKLLTTSLASSGRLQPVVGDTALPLSFRWQN